MWGTSFAPTPKKLRRRMIRLIAVAGFALAAATSAQAMTVQQSRP
jgi:hypothetical protein